MRRIAWAAPLVLALMACGGLEHPVSNDGAYAGNPNGANPGTRILTISASRSPLAVGDTASLIGTVAGISVFNNGAFQSASSDPSVLFVGGTALFARSAGTVTVTASYMGSQATPPLTITVVPAANGSSAIVTVQGTDPPVFAPSDVYVKAGATVEFSLGAAHSVAFDVVSGAPADVPAGLGSLASRAFPTPGVFSYHCSAHGETGTVHVVP